VAIRITAVLVFLALAVSGLVILLNALNAGPGVSVAVLGLFSAGLGGAAGYFSDRIPDVSGRPGPVGSRRSHRPD
jgi:hypothetical protein